MALSTYVDNHGHDLAVNLKSVPKYLCPLPTAGTMGSIALALSVLRRNIRGAFAGARQSARTGPNARGLVVFAILERLPPKLRTGVQIDLNLTSSHSVPLHIGAEAVFASINKLVKDIMENPSLTTPEKMAFVAASNLPVEAAPST